MVVLGFSAAGDHCRVDVTSSRETEDHHLPFARHWHPYRERHRNRALHNAPSYATGAARCTVRASRSSPSAFPLQNVCALLRSGAQRSPRHGRAEHLCILVNVRSTIVSAVDLRSGSLLRSAQWCPFTAVSSAGCVRKRLHRLTPQLQRCTWPHLWRTMARCAGHGFDDVAGADGIAWQGQMVAPASGAGDHCGQ